MQITPSVPADIKELNLLINSAYRGETSKKGWTTEADLLDGLRTDETTLAELITNDDAVILKCIDDENKIKGSFICKSKTKNYTWAC